MGTVCPAQVTVQSLSSYSSSQPTPTKSPTQVPTQHPTREEVRDLLVISADGVPETPNPTCSPTEVPTKSPTEVPTECPTREEVSLLATSADIGPETPKSTRVATESLTQRPTECPGQERTKDLPVTSTPAAVAGETPAPTQAPSQTPTSPQVASVTREPTRSLACNRNQDPAKPTQTPAGPAISPAQVPAKSPTHALKVILAHSRSDKVQKKLQSDEANKAPTQHRKTTPVSVTIPSQGKCPGIDFGHLYLPGMV